MSEFLIPIMQKQKRCVEGKPSETFCMQFNRFKKWALLWERECALTPAPNREGTTPRVKGFARCRFASLRSRNVFIHDCLIALFPWVIGTVCASSNEQLDFLNDSDAAVTEISHFLNASDQKARFHFT
jgi:hypothetical protein